MDVKTNKASCSWYPVEEHVRCGCCYLSAADCGAPKVYNPRKCSCQCPNIEDRRDCKVRKGMDVCQSLTECCKSYRFIGKFPIFGYRLSIDRFWRSISKIYSRISEYTKLDKNER